MLRSAAVATLGFVMLGAACRAAGGGGTLDSFADSASYALGMNMGSTARMAKDSLQRDALIRGLTDALDEGETALDEQTAMRVLRQFATQVQEAEQRGRAAMSDSNQRVGDEFRADNAARSGVRTTTSGLQFEVIQAGAGPRPTAADRVRVHYRGTLVDGTEFDSSHERGEPASFVVSQVIPGWTEALQLMNVGGKYRIVVPPTIGYGEQGAGPDIGPNATLVFEVELLAVEK